MVRKLAVSFFLPLLPLQAIFSPSSSAGGGARRDQIESESSSARGVPFFLCFDKKEGGRGGRRGKGVWGNFLFFPPLKCECGLHGLGRRSSPPTPLSSHFAFGCFWFMSVGKTTSGGGGSRGPSRLLCGGGWDFGAVPIRRRKRFEKHF